MSPFRYRRPRGSRFSRLAVGIPLPWVEILDRSAEKAQVSRSEVIRAAIARLFDRPQALSAVAGERRSKRRDLYPVLLYLPREAAGRVTELARSYRTTPSAVVRRAVEVYVQEAEQWAKAQKAKEANER